MYLPISSVKGIGMYESKISDKRWLILGLLSDIGWIMLFAGIVMYMANGADGLGTVAISALFLVTLLSAVFVLFGVIALITRRGCGRSTECSQSVSWLSASALLYSARSQRLRRQWVRYLSMFFGIMRRVYVSLPSV